MITKENMIQYAMKHYQNPHCSTIKDFENDFKRLQYIKKIIGKYSKTQKLNAQLLLNHIITFYNVFDVEGGTVMLFSVLDEDQKPILKSFLSYLKYLPDYVPELSLNVNLINDDLTIMQQLERL